MKQISLFELLGSVDESLLVREERMAVRSRKRLRLFARLRPFCLILALVILSTGIAYSFGVHDQFLSEIMHSEGTPPVSASTTLNPGISSTGKFLYMPAYGTVTEWHQPDEVVYASGISDYTDHYGIDIATDENAPVYAIADALIHEIGFNIDSGHYISLSHNDGLVSVYENLSPEIPIGIKVGAHVSAGTRIGHVGNSGKAETKDPSHLRFRILDDGLDQNPLSYFEEDVLFAWGLSSAQRIPLFAVCPVNSGFPSRDSIASDATGVTLYTRTLFSEPIYAVGNGIVRYILNDADNKEIAIEYDGGILLSYRMEGGQLSSEILVGSIVTAGMQIGATAETPSGSNPPSLYIEASIHGISVHPLSYFSKQVWNA